MPSVITHNYFMKDVYDKLENEIKNKIILEDAKTFSQGPDIFYFYNLGIGKKSKKYKKIGNYIHKHNTNNFFKNVIIYIKNNKLEKNKQCLSYLYGSISHFVLDSTMHPYIFYKTGVFNKNDKSTHKYSGLHQEMEYYLDAYMIFQNEKKEAKEFKIYKNVLNNNKLNDDTLKLIKNTIYDTYKYENLDKIYEKCIKDMKNFYKYIKCDQYGIKNKIFSLIYKITPRKFRNKRKFTYHLTHNYKPHYLNLDKNEWNNPVDGNEIYNLSFIELYIIAIEKACFIIKKIDKILKYDKIDINIIDELFKNTSYITGKNCDDTRKMKYFEF